MKRAYDPAEWEPLSLEVAKGFQFGWELEHRTLKNKDGSRLRARLNGRPKTWKTWPERVRVPLVHGLKNYFSITEQELGDWEVKKYVADLIRGDGVPQLL